MGDAYTVYSWWTYLISRLLLGGRGRARKALLAPGSSTWRRYRTSAQKRSTHHNAARRPHSQEFNPKSPHGSMRLQDEGRSND